MTICWFLAYLIGVNSSCPTAVESEHSTKRLDSHKKVRHAA